MIIQNKVEDEIREAGEKAKKNSINQLFSNQRYNQNSQLLHH
jgi:hypothetical protein